MLFCLFNSFRTMLLVIQNKLVLTRQTRERSLGNFRIAEDSMPSISTSLSKYRTGLNSTTNGPFINHAYAMKIPVKKNDPGPEFWQMGWSCYLWCQYLVQAPVKIQLLHFRSSYLLIHLGRRPWACAPALMWENQKLHSGSTQVTEAIWGMNCWMGELSISPSPGNTTFSKENLEKNFHYPKV